MCVFDIIMHLTCVRIKYLRSQVLPCCQLKIYISKAYTSAHTKALVPVINPPNWSPEEFSRRDWSQGLLPRSGLRNKTQFEFVGLVVGSKF